MSRYLGDLPLFFSLTLAILIPQGLTAGLPDRATSLAALLVAGLALSYGRALASLLKLQGRSAFVVAFEVVIGFAGASVVHLFATVTLSLAATRAAVVDVAVALLFLMLRHRGRRARVERLAPPAGWTAVACDAAALLAVAGTVSLWARQGITAVSVAQRTGVFPAWSDFFLHASEITYLRDFPAFDRHSLYLSDTLQPFYHRGSYAMAALFSQIAGAPSLETATGFWLPTGLLLCGFAAYGFGAALGGRIAGLAGVGALLLLPDGSMYGLRNAFFGFHWLMQISPGSGYAVAVVLVALGLYVGAVADKDRTRTLASLAIAASAAAFRVHVAIVGTGLLAVMLLLAWRPARARQLWAALGLTALGAAGASFAFERIASAPHLISGTSGALYFLTFVYQQSPVAADLAAALTAGSGTFLKLLVGSALLLPAILGAILPGIVILALLGRRPRMGWRIEALPFVLMGLYLAVILLLPGAAHGDATEFSHRPLVLVYAVLAVFLGVWTAQCCSGWFGGAGRGPGIGSLAVPPLAGLGLLVPWMYGANIQQPDAAWAYSFSSTRIEADVFTAARFVREQAAPGERVLASDEDPNAVLVALSERPAFVSRSPLYRNLGGALGARAAACSAEHARIRRARGFKALRTFGRRNRIGWYLLRQGDNPGWPEALLARCASCSPGLRVFDLR